MRANNRRDFLKKSVLAGASLFTVPSFLSAIPNSNIELSQVLENTWESKSDTLLNNGLKITGTFLDEISHDIPHQNWGVREWERDFQYMKGMGIDTVILIRSGYRKFITYPSEYLLKKGCYMPSVDLVGMALMMRHPKQKEPLVALSVINDNNASETKELIGKRNLERTAMVAAAADASVKTVLRYDLNIAQGIIHTLKEYAVTDVVIGLHRKTNLMDSFFGTMTENLLKGTHRQIMIAKLLMPVNTLRRIVVAVPEKAEYEVGFMKWVVQLCRMGKLLGCRVHFFATEDTLRHLRAVVEKQEANTFTEFSVLEEWDDLLLLTGQVNFDHLFVVVSARKGSISYQTSFERLPSQVSKYFADASLLIIYPDQLGDPQEIVSFSDPRGQSETRMYDNVGKWFYKWFKKGDERN